MYNDDIKSKVETLRRQGKTYREIRQYFDIPKSTLSTWLGHKIQIPFDRNQQLAHLASIRPLAIKVLRESRLKEKEKQQKELKEKINKEIKTFPLKSPELYKAMLAMLYWAEGSKYDKVSGTQFANSSPELSKLYISLLRKCYDLDEKKFRIRLHLHYYHKAKAVKLFWSKLLNIPLSQFASIYIKKRSKKKRFRKNFMGICFIYYTGNAIRIELLELAYALYARVAKQ